jgi:DNA mismatch repair protein MLH3
MHQGRVVSRQTPSAPSHVLDHNVGHGTKIITRDLFGNMPVRVKQRVLAADSSSDDVIWQQLVRGIAALLLAWPRPCAIRLCDISAAKGKSLRLLAHHPTVSNALTERSLSHIGRTPAKLGLKDKLPILVQSGLASVEARHSWVSVSASAANVSVKGAINLQPAPTTRCQFISIGIHPCNPESGLNELYHFVNKLFSKSGFGFVEDVSETDVAEKDHRKRDRRYRTDSYTQKQLAGKKKVDRWPMFVLQIDYRDKFRRHTGAGIVNDSSLKAVVDVLEVMVTQWLEAHHFRPQKRRQRKNEAQRGPAVTLDSSTSSQSGVSIPTRQRTPRTTTPVLSISTTNGNATTSKKRKFVDMSGKTRSLDDGRPASVPPSSTYFNSWSRIKSGWDGFLEPEWLGKAGPLAPVADVDASRANSEPAVSPFTLAPLQAGALSGNKQPPSGPRSECSTSPPSGWQGGVGGDELDGSSDDFGSIDSAAFAAVVEAAEQSNVLGLDRTKIDIDTPDDVATDHLVEWTDPVSKQVFQVNARTGVVLPRRSKVQASEDLMEAPGTAERQRAAINTCLSSTGRPLSLSRRTRVDIQDSTSQWLPGFLKEWSNPVFAQLREEPIPVVSIDGPCVEDAEIARSRDMHKQYNKAFQESGQSGSSKLTKGRLRTATVIRQVDKKFILCHMQTELVGSTLVLVDQHAASERVILERLLAELCSTTSPKGTGMLLRVQSTLLDKPIRFQVSADEHQCFLDSTSRFASWGILYDLKQRDESVSDSQVRAPASEYLVIVSSLPPGIAARCTQYPSLIIDILRTEIWNDTVSSKRPIPVPAESSNAEHAWLNCIGSCPKGILDMLNSRACRSAIMFNDELSLAQCEELMHDLSKCAFPFMCAHGRVSMVPLVGFGTDEDDKGPFGNPGADAVGFGEAYLRWKEEGREADQ